MKIYTRTGDRGDTALFGAGRVGKGHVRVEAMGSVDELNAVLGWVLAQPLSAAERGRLERVQHDLFALGAELATPEPPEGRPRPRTPGLGEGRVEELERWIDEVTAGLPELTAFVLPGGVPAAAALHLARTVCRRAERAVVRLAEAEPGSVDAAVLAYLNRLSDLLFTLARAENHHSGAGDVEWDKG
ncbi:MAG TPA: cob(I)yrinic acid a,c-diamide adenosyltransferase [Longimicrobiales bacterium]|nr:cob(I)yrinic acid a,c-diamide adenosyltransferase [Longimicrobiales bacterium]